MLVGGAGEVELQRVAVDGRLEHDLEIALARLEHVGGAARRRPRAPPGRRGSGARRSRGPRRTPPAACRRRRARAAPPGARAATRPAASCARRSARRWAGWRICSLSSCDRVLVEHLRLDHDALVLERAAVGRHRTRRGAADVGVVGAVGGERDQLAAGEQRRDHGDVGQVGAAAVGIVEDPGAVGLVRARRARRRPPPASPRGARGCARPASPSRRAASNSAVEASRRSLMLAEWAERISTAPISSQIARSAPVSTWSSTGSISHGSSRSQADRAGVVDLARPAVGDQQRRLRQLDHRRALDRGARGRVAAEDLDIDRLAVDDRSRRLPAASGASPSAASVTSAPGTVAVTRIVTSSSTCSESR